MDRSIPDIPGIDGSNVVNAWQVLNGEVEAGNNVVIIGYDEGMQCLTTADFLAERGKKVEVLGFSYSFGSKVEPCTRDAVYQRLHLGGVTLTHNTGVKEISGNTVITYNRFTNEERRIEEVDTVVVACGGRENNALYYAIKDRGTFEGPFAELFRLFLDAYLEKTKDDGFFEVAQPFFAFRVLVIANPRFYPDDSDANRRKLLNFGHAVLETDRFRVARISDYLEPQ